MASVIVADEIFFNLTGKVILQGVYNTDLGIPIVPSVATQLVFYFHVETDVSDPFQMLAVEVTLPEGEPVRHPVLLPPIEALVEAHPERTKIYYRHPMLIQGPSLRPGRIIAKVIHEGGEIELATPWVIGPAAPIVAD